ncbi:MAG TPA: ABC transporter permease [Dehalococcoidia bacterium]|nr:ABC transporter permease [Dehalococcoidia bacterium]
MQTFIIRRLLIGVVVLFVLSIAVFTLLSIVPGDPARERCGLSCQANQIQAIRHQLGLDKPRFPVDVTGGPPLFIQFHSKSQYGDWLKGVVTGDLGTSTYFYQPVTSAIRQRLPVTLELMILTMIFTVFVGIPFGVISAVFRNSPADYLVRVTAIFALSVPSFWVATLVLIVPVTLWGYAPPLGRTVSFLGNPVDNLRQFVPPAAVLALSTTAGIMRLTRSSLLEVMRQDYMRTARAKGLRERAVVFQHGLKNSLIPVVTVLGLQMAGLLGGALIIEQVFVLPGLGQYTFQELFHKDFPVVQTMTLYIGVVVILLNLAVDVSYAWFDPRIRYS